MPYINLSGPDGNAFALMANVQTWGRQLGINTTAIIAEMRSGDYQHLLKTMQDWADNVAHIDLVLDNGEDEDEEEDDIQENYDTYYSVVHRVLLTAQGVHPSRVESLTNEIVAALAMANFGDED